MKIPVLYEIERIIRKLKKESIGQKPPVSLGYFEQSRRPIPYLRKEQLQNCKVFNNRESLLQSLPKCEICAEIGVAYGEFSDKIFQHMQPKELHLIDVYAWGDFWEKDYFKKSGKTHYEWILDKYKNNEKFIIKKGYSQEILEEYPDNYFDYIYIDGGHDFASVKKDINVCERKIKDGGIIVFNDYNYFSLYEAMEYGVLSAFNDFMNNSAHQIIACTMIPSRMDDVAIKINKKQKIFQTNEYYLNNREKDNK